ncbi:MAG: hypothetical protein QOE83_2083 [Actinomycetota bacterium]|nr:hypothetical protein [Actinomycetota bacterium]
MPPTLVSFAGLYRSQACNGGSCGTGYPPDTVGDVGPNNYVEAVNTSIGVFSKTGTLQAAVTFDALWNGVSSPCAGINQGDPTVVYDPIGDRWIVSDFGFVDFTTPPFYECIAVSQTSDPTGFYWLYSIQGDDLAHPYFPDYPKMGVWPDGIYYTANMFDSTEVFQGVRIYALKRTTLEAGGTVTPVIHDLTSSYSSLLPANLRGPQPPSGGPAYFVSNDPSLFKWEVFSFDVDFTTPANSVWNGPTKVGQSSYSAASADVPEPSPGNTLDPLGDRLMMQAQYRNIGGTESIWVSHTVGAAPYKVQWAQIDVTGGTVQTSPVQQQIYGSGGLYRWMPSLAVDKFGDMGLGFSTSSSTVAPGLRYAGRLAGDPLNQLNQSEAVLYQGAGVQTGTCGRTCHRWGDYSAMSVDPVDDCTFWYVGEVYDTNGLNWQTHIGSFRFPACGASPVPVAFSDTGFAPTTLTAPQGSIIRWTNQGPSTSGVEDATTLDLFTSSSIATSESYEFTYIGAGTYTVNDQLAHAMTISVPLKISPRSGGTRTTFSVTWSSLAPPAGASFTVQIKRPGTIKWRSWQTANIGTHANFKPDAGIGTYQFRAKMVNASGSSAYSPTKKVKIT